MSKLHDDLVREVEPAGSPEESVSALLLGIADRIEGCNGNTVKLSDLVTILREDPGKVSNAVLANTPAAKLIPTQTVGWDAPSTQFEKPREGVRQGMVGVDNDHRDQVFPENDRTEAERERIRSENIAVQQGKQVVVNDDMPSGEANREREEENAAIARKQEQERRERMPA